MAWTRTRLEVPVITGDPSVLLTAPPPDGGWTPRLDRTVTWWTGQPSINPESEAVKRGGKPPVLRIGAIGLCASSRLASLGLRAICGLLLFRCRLPDRFDCLPAGITLVGAAPLSCGAPLRRAGGGHARHSLASLCRNPRGKSVNPVSNAEFRGSPDHSSEGSVKGEGEGSGGGDGGPGERSPGRGFEGAGAPRQPQCITLGRLAPRHYAVRRRPRCPASHGAAARRARGVQASGQFARTELRPRDG